MTDSDLIPEMNPADETNFLEIELFQSVQQLLEQVKKATRIHAINA